MKITVGQLRKLFRQGLKEAGKKVGASSGYMKKERVRERLQAMILEAIELGDIKDQKGLDEFVGTLDMAAKALKMVPFDVYKNMHGEKAMGGGFDH
jgi:hypothetical protein